MDTNTIPRESDFLHFASLPPELRQMVWKFAADNYAPVFVEILPKEEDVDRDKIQDPSPGLYTTRSSRGPPSMLHVNHEAREVASQYFKLAFGGVDKRPVYFNFNIDSLHLRSTATFWANHYPIVHEQLAKVKNIVIYAPGMKDTVDLYSLSMSRLTPFRVLKHLSVQGPEEVVLGTLEGKAWEVRSRAFLKVFWGFIRHSPVPVLAILKDEDVRAIEEELRTRAVLMASTPRK